MTFFLADEVAKLQQHLQLLKEQYVRLQQRHSDLEQKYTQAVASSGSVGPHHFVTKLVGMVTGLYDKQLYRYESGWCSVRLLFGNNGKNCFCIGSMVCIT